jgi:hypothetical protein
MKGKFQWSVELKIEAEQAKVWNLIEDVSLIPQYHPDVGVVNLFEGKKKRTVGMKYQCVVLEGKKGSCIEEVVDCIPNEKVTTLMREDTWGMDKIFSDFTVETSIRPLDTDTTILKFEAFYTPKGIFNKILNPLILKRMTKKRSLSVMHGIKDLAEKQ